MSTSVKRGLLTFFMGISLIVTPVGVPAGAQDAPQRYKVNVCNYAGEKISFAYVAHISTDWHAVGWFALDDQQCRPFGGLLSPTFYYYAEATNGSGWPGSSKSFCVPNTAFDFVPSPEPCRSGWKEYQFAEKDATVEGTPVTFTGVWPKGDLPVAPTPGTSEAQEAYDICTHTWNTYNWLAAKGWKSLAVGTTKRPDGSYDASCYRKAGANSEAEAIAIVLKTCHDDHFAKCYLFSELQGLVPWAVNEMNAVQKGARNPAPPPQPAPPPPAAAPPPPQVSDNSGSSDDDNDNDSGPSFGSFLGSALQVLSTGAQLGNAFRGGASVPSYGGSSSNASTCAQLLSMANQCKVNQQNMSSLGSGAGNGTTGQAGAFNDCYNNYMNAYRAERCS